MKSFEPIEGLQLEALMALWRMSKAYCSGRYARMQWTAIRWHKDNPQDSAMGAYKTLDQTIQF